MLSSFEIIMIVVKKNFRISNVFIKVDEIVFELREKKSGLQIKKI